MESNYCAHCSKRRDIDDLNARQVKRYRKFETLYFCKDSDCYLKYVRAHQTLSQIKQVQSNIRNYSRKPY